ncbi:MAG: folate-binding protein, partial [Rhodospirillaceae bacterium]
SRFRLRADVQLSRLEDFKVSALFGPGAAASAGLSGAAGTTLATDGVIVFIDPRNEAIGCRASGPRERLDDYLSRLGVPEVDIASYEALRISLEIPDGSRDMEIEKSTLLECNFDELNGVDWEKGCYMG